TQLLFLLPISRGAARAEDVVAEIAHSGVVVGEEDAGEGGVGLTKRENVVGEVQGPAEDGVGVGRVAWGGNMGTLSEIFANEGCDDAEVGPDEGGDEFVVLVRADESVELLLLEFAFGLAAFDRLFL